MQRKFAFLLLLAGSLATLGLPAWGQEIQEATYELAGVHDSRGVYRGSLRVSTDPLRLTLEREFLFAGRGARLSGDAVRVGDELRASVGQLAGLLHAFEDYEESPHELRVRLVGDRCRTSLVDLERGLEVDRAGGVLTAEASYEEGSFPPARPLLGPFGRACEGELFFRRWGPRRSTPRGVVALVHGGGDHSGRYTTLVEHLRNEGYVIYAYDQRGHGNSPGQRGHIVDWADYREDLGAFLALIQEREAQAGLPLFLYAHSLGGLVAMDYVLHYPDTLLRGVVISAPAWVQPNVLGKSSLKAMGKLVDKAPWLPVRVIFNHDVISNVEGVVAHYDADSLTHHWGSAGFVTSFDQTWRWVQANAQRLNHSLLVVHSELDGLNPIEGSRRFLQGAGRPDALLSYSSGGHELHNDREALQLADDVAGWLEAQATGE